MLLTKKIQNFINPVECPFLVGKWMKTTKALAHFCNTYRKLSLFFKLFQFFLLSSLFDTPDNLFTEPLLTYLHSKCRSRDGGCPGLYIIYQLVAGDIHSTLLYNNNNIRIITFQEGNHLINLTVITRNRIQV